jgi:hypothetical protein
MCVAMDYSKISKMQQNGIGGITVQTKCVITMKVKAYFR